MQERTDETMNRKVAVIIILFITIVLIICSLFIAFKAVGPDDNQSAPSSENSNTLESNSDSAVLSNQHDNSYYNSNERNDFSTPSSEQSSSNTYSETVETISDTNNSSNVSFEEYSTEDYCINAVRALYPEQSDRIDINVISTNIPTQYDTVDNQAAMILRDGAERTYKTKDLHIIENKLLSTTNGFVRRHIIFVVTSYDAQDTMEHGYFPPDARTKYGTDIVFAPDGKIVYIKNEVLETQTL